MSAAFALAPPVWRRSAIIRGNPSALRKRPRVTPARITLKSQTDPAPQQLPTPATAPKAPPASSNGVPAPAEATEVLKHDPRSLKSDIIATLSFVAVAAGTAAAIYTQSPTHALEFITAYIVEYSLSVDNLFVFLLIFEYFRVPRASQTRVLSYGIVGAVLMRGVMIVVGEALTHRFKFVSVGFAALLLFSAGKLLLEEDNEDGDLSDNAVVKFSRGLLDFSSEYDGDRFFTVRNGARVATPMLLVLLCIEFSDVVFALDSVPAVLGISDDSLVIYVSNILAIMGLRNLYFVLSDAIGDLRFLRQSLAIVLGFVGGKMLAGVAGVEVGVVQSLSVVVGTLVVGVGLSVAFPEEAEAEAEA